MNTVDCRPCCTTTPPVQVPGIEGPSGIGEQGPPGLQGEEGPSYTFALAGVFQEGAPYVLTATPAVITGMTKMLPTAGTWMLFATVEIDLDTVTYAAPDEVTVTIRRTNDNTDQVSRSITIPIVTAETSILSNVVIPISYAASTASDILELWASVSALPDNAPAGTILARNPRLEMFRLFTV